MARPSHWYFIKVPQSDFTLTITMASQLNIKNLLVAHLYRFMLEYTLYNFIERSRCFSDMTPSSLT